MEEVTKQLIPTNKLLESIDRWKASLWSNGSGGPPGYLEVARKEDDERYDRLFKSIEDLGVHKSTVETFLTLFKEREEQREKVRKFWLHASWKIAGVIGGGILSLCLWLVHASAPVVKILWEDYLRSHPYAQQQIHPETHHQEGETKAR